MAIALIAGIASAGSAIIAAGGFAAISGWAIAGAFALGAGLSLVSRALQSKPDIGTQMGGQSITTREAAQSRKIVYGRARIGGNIAYLESTGDDNKYLWLVITVAGHEIDAYESVWFNDEKIWNGTNYLDSWGDFVNISFYKGDQTTADNALRIASATNNGKWTTDHKLLDTAYMVVKLTHDPDKFSSGLPNISTIIRGKKVLHTANVSAGNFYVGERYKITEVGDTNFVPIGAASNTVGIEFIATNVGSGSGKANHFDWSQNPALCIYDYLRETKYGLGEAEENILTSSVSVARSVCDEPITIAANVTQARYTMDGVVDSANSIKNNIELMVGSMAGRLVYSGGKFEIHAGKYIAPSFTVDESQIVGDITIQTKQSRRNAYNGVKGVFLSEDDNYILADYPAQQSKTTAGDFVVTTPPTRYKILEIGTTDFTAIGAASNTVGLDFGATGVGSGDGVASLFLAQDGEAIFLDMALPYTANNIRAQRLAKLALFRSRQQEAITIPCNLSALRFKVGDNISVNNTRLGYAGKVFEVVGYAMDFKADGQIVINVNAMETASSIWDWQASDAEVFLGAGEVDLYTGAVAIAPIGIGVTSDSFLSNDGTFNSQFKVTWTNAVDAFTDHYVVEWKLASDTYYFSQTTKATPFHIVNLVNNASYNVRVKAVNELGVSSAYLSASETSATDTTAPDAPSPVSANGEFEQITINWTNPTVDDFSHVLVYRSDTLSGTYAFLEKSFGTTFIDTGLLLVNELPVQKFYKLRSVDYSGNATKNAQNQPVYSAIVNATTTLVPVGGIADDAVGTEQIADQAVETDQLDDDAVTIAKIAASLQSTNYVSGSFGWKIQKSGAVEFEQAIIRGGIFANDGEIGGFDIAGTYLKDAANTMGLSSVASSADDVRFWAGNTFANRATAPFFVTKGGALKATKITVSGTAPLISIGTNSADTITLSTASDYRMWVGSSTPENAKFSVHKDGTLTAKGMHLQDGSANAYFSPQGFTDLAYSEIAANTASRVSKFESNLVYNLQSVKVTLIQSTSLTLGIKASNLFSGLDLSSVTIGSAQSMANALADIPDNFTLKIQKSTTSAGAGFTDVVSQAYTKVTTGSSSATNYRATSAYFVPSGTTTFATPAEIDVSNHASVTGLDENGDRTLENTATYAQDVYYFRVQLTTTDTSYDTSLNNLTTWPRSFLVEDNGSTGFNVISANEITQAAASGDITGVEAGTNLNGGGASGDVILNLDSTIIGDHTFEDNLTIEGNLTVQGTTTTVDTDDLNVKDKNITLNYSTGDSSGNANGAGITIQDAVNSTTNATILWDSTNDKFDFSHKLTTPSLDVGGNIAVTGTVDGVDIATRDGVLTTTTTTANSANTTANAALPKAGGTLTGGLSGTTASFSSTLDSGNITISQQNPKLVIKTDSNSTDPIIEMTSSGAMSSEGFHVQYSNSVGDVHLGTSFNNDAAAIRFHTKTSDSFSTSNERFTIKGNGDVAIVSGGLYIGNQEVITSGRVLTNISLGDVSTNKLTLLNGATANLEMFVAGTGTATTHFRLSTASSSLMELTQSGNLSTIGTLSATGGNSTNWNTAYTYSQVGHLPLTGGTLTGVLTINNTNDNQILLTSPSSWTGIGFNDSAAGGTEYLWHNGTHGTFAFGGGGSSVANKKLHVDGGMTVGSTYDATAVDANSLKVQGTIESAGGSLTGTLNITSASSTVLNLDSSATTLVVPIGAGTQTDYTDLQLITDGGNAELFKGGINYTSWGGSRAFNIYNSNGIIAFHPSGTENIVQITTDGLLLRRNYKIRDQTVATSYIDFDSTRSFMNGSTGVLLTVGDATKLATFNTHTALANKLMVSQIATPQKNLTIGSSQAEGIQFNYDTSNNYRNQILNYWNSSADSRMDFNIARLSGQTPVTIMSVGYNSKVGINTTVPSSLLTVDSGAANSAYSPTGFNSAAQIKIDVASAQNNYAGIQFTHSGITEGFIGLVRPSTSASVSDFVIQGYSGATSTYKERLRIADSGAATFAGAINIASGGLSIGGQEVITSGRVLTNIALGDINTNKLTLLNGATANMEMFVVGTGTATTHFRLSTASSSLMELTQAGNLAPIGGLTTTTGAFSGKILTTSDVVVGNTSGDAYNTLSGGQLYFADDDLGDKLGYSIGLKRKENINGNYTKLNIDWHTGITLGAASTYGGVRFFDNSVGYYNSTTKLFSVGEGDSHVRVYNDLKMGSTTVINASRNMFASAIGIGTTSITDTNWGSGNAELAIDGTTGYGVIHLRGTGAGSADTRYSVGVGDNTFYMAYDDVAGVHRAKINTSKQLVVNDDNSGDKRVFHDAYHPNADKWTTARTLTLSGNVTGSVTFDGSAAINMTNTVVGGNISVGTISGTGNITTRAANVVIDAQSSADGQTVGFRAGYLSSATLAGHFRYTTGDAQLYIDNAYQGNNSVYSTINFRNCPNGSSSLTTRLKIHGSSGNVDVTGSSFQMGGTTVIDASRNITAGTISSGNITAPKYYLGSNSSVYGVGIVNATSARFDTVDSGYSTDPLELVYHNGTGVKIGSGGSKYLAAGSYQIGTTTVIDGSRNISAGTISSGSISSSGSITTTGNFINNTNGGIFLKSNTSEANNWLFKENAANWGIYYFNSGSEAGATVGAYTTVGAEYFFTSSVSGYGPVMPSTWTGTQSGSYLNIMLSPYRGYIYAGDQIEAKNGYRLNGTTVIDSSRQISNVTALCIGQDVSAMDTTNLDLDIVSNASIRGASYLYFGITSANYGSWKTRIGSANSSTMYIHSQGLIHSNVGYGSSTFFTSNSTGMNIQTGGLLIGGVEVITDARVLTNIALGDINTNKLTLLNGASANMEMFVSGTGTATTNFRLSNASSNIMTLSQTGELTTTGKVVATQFKDSDDQAYYAEFANTTLSGKFRRFVVVGDGTQGATNDGGWGARLNVTDDVHSKIEVNQDANSMRSHWYAHTGHDSIKFGTSTAHDVEIHRGGATKIEAQADGANITGNFKVGGTTVIDASRNATFATVDINAGTGYPLQTSTTSRYQIQIRNPNNTVSASYGWWLATDTNFNFALHADGSADKFTLTRNGDATFTGSLSSGSITANGSITPTSVINMSSSGAYFKGNSAHGYRFNNQADSLNLVTIFDNGTVRLHQGSLQIATVDVIDTSRNLVNIGTISSGDITCGNIASGVVTINTTSATALNIDSSANSLLVPIGGSAQTAYVDLQLISDGGSGEIFKGGTLYSGWGGLKAFNFYNSDGILAFHPSGTANVFQISSSLVSSTKATRISGSHSNSISTPNIDSYGALSSGTAYNYHIIFKQADGTVRGQITNNVYGTQYTGASDYRLKENIQPLSSATSLTLALNPCTFNWIQDADNTVVQGFVAHEVAAIVPEAVVGEKDAMTAPTLYLEGEELPEGVSVGDIKVASAPDYQTIDQSKLIPILVKTIQELEARITALESA